MSDPPQSVTEALDRLDALSVSDYTDDDLALLTAVPALIRIARAAAEDHGLAPPSEVNKCPVCAALDALPEAMR